MSSATAGGERRKVLVAGGGVAALETVLALADLAPGSCDVTMIAPDAEFRYRPMSVQEPFAHAAARSYPLAPIAADAGAKLVTDKLVWVDRAAQTVHTEAGASIDYDALVLAVGARANARYEHAVTIEDTRMDEILHGIIQDVEAGYITRLTFLAPARMAWPLPLYELALLTAGRAYDMGADLSITLITPEDGPLAIFGETASSAVSGLLTQAGIETISSAYAEVPSSGRIVINPGDRELSTDRVIALPELYGPAVRGVPLSEHGFLRTTPYGEVLDAPHIYAAGDCTEFPVKHGGVSSQQADSVAQSIAADAGAPVMAEPFHPVIHGMLLTAGAPLYLTARITGGQGFSSEVSDSPTWDPPGKIAARYLAPYLASLDLKGLASSSAPSD
ncbi:MAG: FAD-dependent oxidoreductase [Acidobacteriota bacterium]|nr:FAD-dependent oxidoreductase [Acidobacteriota bacterium]